MITRFFENLKTPPKPGINFERSLCDSAYASKIAKTRGYRLPCRRSTTEKHATAYPIRKTVLKKRLTIDLLGEATPKSPVTACLVCEVPSVCDH